MTVQAFTHHRFLVASFFKIVDVDANKTVEEGRTGEIFVRGPIVMEGTCHGVLWGSLLVAL